MPPLSDTSIVNWQDDYLGQDTNSPQGSDAIATMLDDQARNIKSVERAESENKAWVRPGLLPTYISATSFSVPDDQRVDFSVGRRVRATITGGTKYGTILSSSYASNVTTVTVQWDLEKYVTGSLLVTSADVMEVVDDDIPLFPVGGRVLFADATGLVFVRTVASAVDTGADADITFTSGDPAISLLSLTDGKAYVPSLGIDNTITEVELGAFTPDAFQSGMPHGFIAGTSDITLNGTNGPFTVSLPVMLDDANYRVFITPQKVVSGTPSAVEWKKPYNSSRAQANFNVSFPTGTTPNSAVVRFDYVIWRQ